MASGEHGGAGGWGGLSPSVAMQMMPAFLAATGGGGSGGHQNGGGTTDPAVLAAAYAQLQQNPHLLSALAGAGRRFGGRTGPQPDRSGIKKCGHCQRMKSCVEFSADTSRGDGLRGWCKLCEAEARSTRYKKRKAAAQAATAACRRVEEPLGGMFWGGGGATGHDGTAAFSQVMDPALVQQAMLWHFQQHMLAQQSGGGARARPGSAFHTVGRKGGGSPGSSDSENSASERYRKRQRLATEAAAPGSFPGGQAPVLKRASASDDSAALGLVGFTRSLSHQLSADAPLPPTEVHVPKRSRTRCAPAAAPAVSGPAAACPRQAHSSKMRDISSADAAASLSLARAAPIAAAEPPAAVDKHQQDTVKWASTMMSALLLMRASTFVRKPNPAVPELPPQEAKPLKLNPPAAAIVTKTAVKVNQSEEGTADK